MQTAMAIVAALGLLLGIGLDNGSGVGKAQNPDHIGTVGKAQKPNENGNAYGESIFGFPHNNTHGNDGIDGIDR